MTQTFPPDIHQKFKKYFSIKDSPSETDTELFEKTKKYIPSIKWIPGIRFIGVGNSTSMFASKKSSDIDLFIITSPKRMWLVRILTTLIFQILGVRKTAKHHEKRFCLSFFCTTENMNFENFALENDVYLYFRIVYLKPILDFDNTFENFITSQTWADFSPYQNFIKNNKSFISFSGKSLGKNYKIFDYIDFLLEKIFLPKTKKSFEQLGKPYGIIINKNILKFHNDDKRKEIKDKILL